MSWSTCGCSFLRPQPPAANGFAAYVTTDEQREQPQLPASLGSAPRQSEAHLKQQQKPAVLGITMCVTLLDP